MRCAWLIVILLLCSGFVSSDIVMSENAGIRNCAEKLSQWVEVDRISKTIEVDPLSSYYFQIKNLTLLENGIDKLPISNALKRVPNWLRDDLEKNLKQLANATVDVGDQAAPALFDFDEDGDLDIIVGTADGYMYIYEQKNNFWVKAGTLNDSAGSPIYAGSNAVPCFEDMNGDGYLDLVVGTWDGRIKWYENTTEGWIYNGYLQDNNDNTIDVGSYSAPAFGKVYMTSAINSGLKDLIIGAEDGKLYLYENTGNSTSAIWTSRGTLSEGILEIDVGSYSKPAFSDINNDNKVDLTIGADDGTLHYYGNTGTQENAVWTEDSSVYENFEACAYPAPHFGDLDRNKLLSQDCVFDLVVGRGDGHIHIYKNLGTVKTPRWDVWPNAAETIEHHMDYQDLTRLDKYLNLICDVENKYVDEIAFCIAHTSPDVLADEDVYPEVFVKNAELIYEIDNYIQYADIVYRGSNTTGDYWSTVEYNYYNNTTGMIEKHELPRDIYYWYIVHPKITDEIPTFINPDTGDADKNGYFWREYLFFYADDTYPDDPDTDPNNDGIPDYNYPKDEPPPSLKDKIANITVLYDGIPYVAPKGHDNDGYMYEPEKNRSWQWSYNKGHAIEIVSNWVEKTLTLNEQESNDGERPIQPVRIAHHHNGNCGELQDLTVAAARTCLIPAAGVNLIGEDHVWSEFYCNNSWHQWDNYWSDSGSVIDDFDNYWGGGERGGSGIFRWNGDDSIDDRTADYVPTAATITITVTDANDNPVDGARVLVSSYWLVDNQIESITGMSMGFIHYIPNTAMPSIWDYTDSNGICEFRLVGSFQIAIASKLGSTTSDMDFEDGESYTPTFKLQDTSPNPHPKAEEGMPSGDYLVEITYDVLQGVQIQPPSPIVEDMHFENVPAHIDLFTCTEDEMENFMCGKTFNYIAFQSNRTSGTLFSSSLSGEGYIVFSNGDGIETSKIINVTIILKRLQEWAPTVTISNISMPISGLVTVSGTASSQSAGNIIKNVWVKVDDSAWYLANGTNSWNYGLDITFYYLGNHTIYVRVIDNGNCYAVASRTWLFEDHLVDITIVEPLENEIISGAAVQVGGTAVDYDGVVELIEIRLANETWREVTDRQNNDWSSTVDATVVNDGIQKIYVKAFDGILYSIKEISVVVDNTYPTISVSSPENNEYVSGIATVAGEASDINGIRSFFVRTDYGNWSEIDFETKEYGLPWPVWTQWNYKADNIIKSVSVSSDGDYIVAGGNDKKVYLFQKNNCTPLWSYETNCAIDVVDISSDGSYIVAGSSYYKLFLFQKNNSTPVWTYDPQIPIDSVSISSDGNYIVAGGGDIYHKRIYLFSKESSTPLWNYTADGWIYSVDISADGNYIAAGSGNKVYLFNKDSNMPLWNYTTEGWILSISISSNGTYVAAGIGGGEVLPVGKLYLFEKDKGLLWNYTAGDWVGSVSISSSGSYIAAGSYDCNVYLFQKENNIPLWTYKTGNVTWSVSISSEGDYIIAGSYDNYAYLFQKDSNTPILMYYMNGAIYSVSISADGLCIAIGDSSHNISVTQKVMKKSSRSLTWNYLLDTTLLSEGFHTIYARAYDGKHNQTASVTVIVDNNKPPEVLYSPTANSVTIYENSTQEFRILDIRDMESQAISIIWYLDGKNITSAYNKYSYNFSANYSSASSYQIRVEVWDSFWSKEAATQTWTLTVMNVNRIPKINYYSPEIRELTINELENILFYANASDPDGESLSIEWKVNNISKSTGKSYTFSTNYLSAGVYTIAVRVSDGKDAVEQIWRVRVLDINTPPSAGFSPDQKEQTIKKNTQRLFSVENISDSENDELTITWYVNGNAVSEVHISPGDYSDYTYTFTSSGRYVISVSVSDGKTAISNTWLVNVEQPPTEKPIPGFEMQIFLIALSIATIILLAKRFRL